MGFFDEDYDVRMAEGYVRQAESHLAYQKRMRERAKAKGYQVAPNSYEGVRITFDTEEVKGWLLLRMSLHDPQMPLNVEGVRAGDCDRLYQIVTKLLEGFERLVMPQ